MAIIVEEEKKSVNWFMVVIVLVVVVVVFSGAYFLFFQRPDVIEVVTPGKLDQINKLSKISFKPEEVVNSPSFKSLRQYGSSTSPTQTPGRENPFKPF